MCMYVMLYLVYSKLHVLMKIVQVATGQISHTIDIVYPSNTPHGRFHKNFCSRIYIYNHFAKIYDRLKL
jgi:hypothetical protein